MSNKLYDILNIVAKIIAPLATLVSAILTIWNVPYAEQITATFAAIDVFMGSIVVVAKSRYDSSSGDDE